MSNLATIIQMNAALTPQHVVLLTLDTFQWHNLEIGLNAHLQHVQLL
jgi:hypothetical protein